MVGVKVTIDHGDVIHNQDVTYHIAQYTLWGQYHGTLSPINEMMVKGQQLTVHRDITLEEMSLVWVLELMENMSNSDRT